MFAALHCSEKKSIQKSKDIQIKVNKNSNSTCVKLE